MRVSQGDEAGKVQEGWRQPVVPTNLRIVVRVVGSLSATVTLVLSVALHEGHAPGLLDRSITTAVRATWPRVGLIAYVVDGLAAPLVAALIVTALGAACLLTKRWRLGLVAGFGPLGVVVVATVLKSITGRTIHGANLAFPSGHTAFATAVALVIGLLVVGVIRPGRCAGLAILMVLGVLGGAAMALDQVLLNAHFPSDTVGGFFTAVAVMALTAIFTDWLVVFVGRHCTSFVDEPARSVVTH